MQDIKVDERTISLRLQMSNKEKFIEKFLGDPFSEGAVLKDFTFGLTKWFEDPNRKPIKKLSHEVVAFSDNSYTAIDAFNFNNFLRSQILDKIPYSEFKPYNHLNISITSLWELYYFDVNNNYIFKDPIQERFMKVVKTKEVVTTESFVDLDIGLMVDSDYVFVTTPSGFYLETNYTKVYFLGDFNKYWIDEIAAYATDKRHEDSVMSPIFDHDLPS